MLCYEQVFLSWTYVMSQRRDTLDMVISGTRLRAQQPHQFAVFCF